MTFSFWHRDLQSNVQADVAIIGGGIAGVSTAYWLKKLQPDLNVVLIEAKTLAYGASGRNAGFLIQGTANDYATEVETYGRENTRRFWDFTRENHLSLAQELNWNPLFSFADWQPCGSFTAAGTQAEADRLTASAALMAEDGIEVSLLDEAEANRRMKSKGFYNALFCPANGMVRSGRMIRELARKSDAQIYENHPVGALSAEGDRIRIEVAMPATTFWAKKVVVCLNAYAPLLVPELSRYVRPVRAQMLSTVPHPSFKLDAPVYSHEGYYYIRSVSEGALLLGGARHLHVEEEVGFEDAVTPALQADLESYLAAYFPEALGVPVAMRWSGTMGFSPDHLPCVGTLSDLPKAHFICGFSGHGMGYGFRMGKLMAEKALDHPSPAYADLFDVARFAQP